jgi:hypothetical protein
MTPAVVLRDAVARIVVALEALADGDTSHADVVLRDLELDLLEVLASERAAA